MSVPSQLFQRAMEAHQTGDLARADGLYRRILSKSPRHAGALMHLGLIEQNGGRLREARALIEKATHVEPDNPSVRNSLGQILLAQDQHDAAAAEFRAATASEPSYGPAWHNLGLVQAMQGDFASAVESFRRAVGSSPADPQLLLNLGQALGETGAFDEAVETLLGAVRLQPAVPQIRLALGDVLMHAGDAAKAIHHYREVERLVPGNSAGPHRIGLAMQQIGDIEASIAALERTRKLAPDSTSVKCDLANAYAMAGAFERARELFGEVARLSDQVSVIGVAARGLIAAGGADPARKIVAPFIASGNDDPEIAIAMAELAGDPATLDQVRARLEKALKHASPGQKITALFALAEVEHRRGDFDQAFARASEANALKKARFDAAAEAALVDRIIDVTDSRAPDVCAKLVNGAPKLVFAVGMQRSGLRLVESIVTAHPDVASLGGAGAFQATVNAMGHGAFGYLDAWDEIAEDTLTAAAEAHMERIRARTNAATVVEALPGNLFHVGLIQRLFSDARVILCQRPPLDRCLSCYFQDFAGASPYAYDLDALGHHSRSVDRLVDHWRSQDSHSTSEMNFDVLVSEPESAARMLLDELGISWHASCSEQVDSRRVSWRKRHTDYRHLLDPLVSALETKDA